MSETREMLNEWDGYVEAIEGDAFSAVLYDTKRPDLIEVAEFPLASLSAFDRARLQIGSYLKWDIFKTKAGEVKSRIWLRRWIWKKRDLERADREAKKLFEALWGVSDPARSEEETHG